MSNRVTIDEEYLLSVLRELVSINSVLPNEGIAAEFLAEELSAFGLEPEWQEVSAGRPNICATADLGPSDRFLVFSGHSDTVGPASDWETDPFELTESDGRLYGLGVFNMKAGLACSMAAFKAVLEATDFHGSLGRLGFAATVDQEGHSLGAKALLDTEYGRCDAMLHAEHFYGDSEEDYLPIAGTGKVLYKLIVKGRAAHAFRPHLGGINAVTDAARIVSSLDRLPLRKHPLFGTGTTCVLRIEGGPEQYSIVVPERCEIIVTRLTVPGKTRELAIQDMRELIASLELESEVEIEIAPPYYDPYFLDETTRILGLFKDAYRRVIGVDPHFAGHRGIIDANVFVGEGQIPTIAFGPKGANHHCAGEYVEKSTLEPVARAYAETALDFLS